MDRRKFIKTSLCAGCVAALGGGCFFSNNKNKDLAVRPWDKFKYTDVSQLPREVRLEACNDCQLNCPECYVRRGAQDIIDKNGGFGYLKFSDFKNFIDNHSFIDEIELSNNGEIFLNPELDDIMKYAYEKGVILTANNGVNLNTVSEKTLENLVKYQLRDMVVSIDGATPEVYRIYRRGGDLNTVLNNIKIINKYKKQYNSEYPYLQWQFILFGHNEHEIDLAKERAAELGMEIYFAPNESPDYSPIHNPEMVEEKTGVKFVNRNADETNNEEEVPQSTEDYSGTVDYEETDNAQAEEGQKIGVVENDMGAEYCLGLVRFPQINFNGDLLGCCILGDNSFKVNVFKEGLLNALNSEHVIKAKLMLSDFSQGPFEELACSSCGVYHDLKNADKPVDFFKGAYHYTE